MFKLFVLAYLCRGDEVLLLRRLHANFGDGLYSFVGGKAMQGEPALQAIHREVLEEVALDIPITAFELVHTLHRKGTENEVMLLCFKTDISGLEPRNNEPDKCDDMRFFKIRELPENMIPAHRQIIELVEQGIRYSEHGWE